MTYQFIMAVVYYNYGITTQIASIRGRKVISSRINEIVGANQEVKKQKAPMRRLFVVYNPFNCTVSH
tara:strand:+ start:1110 stop:1310 length:201 start_codon:yes stop_codon:yes gene_type:complete